MIKFVYKAKRLDGIAPKCDRAYITIGHISALLCLVASALVIVSTFALPDLPLLVTVSTLTIGYTLQVVAITIAIKETVRNRFFSAVRLCIFSVITLAAVITATCLFVIY